MGEDLPVALEPDPGDAVAIRHREAGEGDRPAVRVEDGDVLILIGPSEKLAELEQRAS